MSALRLCATRTIGSLSVTAQFRNFPQHYKCMAFMPTTVQHKWASTAAKRIEYPTAMSRVTFCELEPKSKAPLKQESQRQKTHPYVGYWMLATGAMVFGIVVLGGLTRLTESGLSMVHWRWVHFAPPATEKQWEDELLLYKASPEGRTLNAHIGVAEFKRIYWMEHSHRVAGRVLGMAVIGPAAYLLTLGRRHVPSRGMRVTVGAMAGLVVAQGAMGWHMVRSGLQPVLGTEEGGPARVSHYRLAAHLSLAFALYGLTLGAGLRVLRGPPVRYACVSSSLRGAGHGLAGLTVLTALTGALVAGLDAGLIYDTFPLMGGRVLPSDAWDPKVRPAILNLTQNPSMVQFVHRTLAIATVGGLSAFWAAVRRTPAPLRRAATACVSIAWIQAALGVSTLLMHVPIPLASAHQATSLVLIASLIHMMRLL